MNDETVLGKDMLRGLFDAERKFGWRPWLQVGIPSFFLERHFRPSGDGTIFNMLLTPINMTEFRNWCVQKLGEDDSDELADIILIAAYRRDSGLFSPIKARFETGPSLNANAVAACLAYFILCNIVVDDRILAEKFASSAYGKTHLPGHANSCRAMFFAYWNQFPQSIHDEDLYLVISKEDDQRLLRDYCPLMGRLLVAGYALAGKIPEVAGYPGMHQRFGQAVADMVIRAKSVALARECIESADSIKCSFATSLLRAGGYGFLKELIEDYVQKDARNEELYYFLPLLAAIVPDDGSWLAPFEESSFLYARRGAAYALAYYKERRGQLDRLALDKDDDVSIAAKFSLAVQEHASPDTDDVLWHIGLAMCLFPLRRVPLDLIDAICFNMGLNETPMLRNWRLLRSNASFEELQEFYSSRTGFLAETILRMDIEKTKSFEFGVEDYPDVLGRSLLLLCMSDPDGARILLDQSIQDCKSQDAVKWLGFFLSVCGGPFSTLTELKCRIVANIENPNGLVFTDADLALFPILVADDFCLEPIIRVNGARICETFPYAIGKWIRSDIDPDARAILASSNSSPLSDPFLDDISRLMSGNQDMDGIPLPERFHTLDLGAGNSRKGRLFGTILGEKAENKYKYDKSLLLINSTSVDEKCSEVYISSMLECIHEREKQVGFLLHYVREDVPSPITCAAIGRICQYGFVEALPVLLKEWQTDMRGDVLSALHEAICRLGPENAKTLNLYSCGSASYLARKYELEYDDMLEYFPDKEASLNLLISGMVMRTDPEYLVAGDYIMIQKWGNGAPPNSKSLLNVTEVEKIMLRLSLVFGNDDSGIFLCRVGERNTDEVIRLLFDHSKGSAFWAYRSSNPSSENNRRNP